MEGIDEFVGVYDADAGLLGEVSYWVGTRIGRTHCSLCTLTHGTFTVKPAWREGSRSLGVPFRTFHRNDAPADVLATAAGRFPVVLARTPEGLRLLLDPEGLERFGGVTSRFLEWLNA
ncbi:MAG: hypothetical protein WCI50_07100 [Actinomycetes bacterium]